MVPRSTPHLCPFEKTRGRDTSWVTPSCFLFTDSGRLSLFAACRASHLSCRQGSKGDEGSKRLHAGKLSTDTRDAIRHGRSVSIYVILFGFPFFGPASAASAHTVPVVNVKRFASSGHRHAGRWAQGGGCLRSVGGARRRGEA